MTLLLKSSTLKMNLRKRRAFERSLPVRMVQHTPAPHQARVRKDKVWLDPKTTNGLQKFSKFGDSLEADNNSEELEELLPAPKRVKTEKNSCLGTYDQAASIAPSHIDMASCESNATRDNVKEISDSLQFKSTNSVSPTELDVDSKFVEGQMGSDQDTETKPGSQRMKVASLAEFLTKDQIKEHISSLRQYSADKDLSDNVKENKIAQCQLCGLGLFLLARKVIYCSSCAAPIKRKVNYYCTPEEYDYQHFFCTTCYKRSRGGHISICDMRIPKEKLQRRNSDSEIEESWVQCDECDCWQHQVCGLFQDDQGEKTKYKCPICLLREEKGQYESLTFSAKDLPQTMLSTHIEERLLRRLEQERKERAKFEAKSFDEVPGAENLTVRVVLSKKKKLRLEEQLLDTLKDQDYPAEFPYTSKLILLFQKIEGVDVCIFSMYIQEFGSECSRPNQRCVYISYLDSIKYFTPSIQTSSGEALRSLAFHEILIGYIDYIKTRGFTTCYLWACPPVKGDDFFFYCHPETQKIPKSDMLRQWYHSMLRKATNEGIVASHTNLYDHFFIATGEAKHRKITTTRLPYFDGAYWSGAAENFVKNVEKENKENASKRKTKTTLKVTGHTNSSDVVTNKDVLLMKKLGQAILPYKQNFIVIFLQSVCTNCREPILSRQGWFCNQCKDFHICQRCHDIEQYLYSNNTHISVKGEQHMLSEVLMDVPFDTKDEDDMFDSGLFENRYKFLKFCKDNKYQFDSLRRAKHSSMMILYHLRHLIVPTAAGTSTVSHDARSKVEPEEMLRMKLLQLLQHANQCQSTKTERCPYKHCHNIQATFLHASMCRVRTTGGCTTCKKMWYLLILHAKSCTRHDCRVSHCKELKRHPALKCETHRRASIAESDSKIFQVTDSLGWKQLA